MKASGDMPSTSVLIPRYRAPVVALHGILGPPALSGSHGRRQGGVPASRAAMICAVTST